MSCIVDNNKQIDTPLFDIVNYIKSQCVCNGIDKLQSITQKHNNLSITCPSHKGGLEERPSCQILLEDKESVYRGKKIIIPAGTVHCFTCGYKANLIKFIKDCFSTEKDFWSYRRALEWLLSVSDYSYIEENRQVDFEFEDEEETNYNNLPKITLEELRSYDYTHKYMYERKLTDEVIDKFEVGYSPKENCITFPVYVDGVCIFVAKRRVDRKLFYMPKDLFPKPIYGLDYVSDENEVYVCESIINALTLWSWGMPAVALFGTGTEYQINRLNNINARKIVLCLDGDSAGRNGMRRISNGLTNKMVYFVNVPDGKDVNDLTKEEFLEIEETF